MHRGLPFNRHTGHRLLLTSVILAIKFHDDETFGDAYYAAVAGLREISTLTTCLFPGWVGALATGYLGWL